MQTRFLTDKRGQYLVQFVIWFPLLLLMLGMVLDGGMMYWQYRRAHNAVNIAAQAASQCVNIPHFLATNEVILDQAKASQVAQEYATLNSGGQVQIVGVHLHPQWISVRAQATIHTLFLQPAGIGSFTVGAEGRAYPAFGIALEGE